MLKFNSFCLKR